MLSMVEELRSILQGCFTSSTYWELWVVSCMADTAHNRRQLGALELYFAVAAFTEVVPVEVATSVAGYLVVWPFLAFAPTT